MLMWLVATPDGWSNLFGGASQVVSVFAAVFIVLATVQRPASRSLSYTFSAGKLEDYHQTDIFLVKVAVATVFTCLFGSFMSKYTDKGEPVIASLGRFSIAFSPWGVGVWVISLLLICDLVVLFASLTDYYFMRGRSFLFSDMVRQVLDQRFDELHDALVPNVLPLRPEVRTGHAVDDDINRHGTGPA